MQLPENWLKFSSETMVRAVACTAILLGLCAGYSVGYQAYSWALKSRISWQAGQNGNAKSWHRIMPIKTAELREKALGVAPAMAFSPVDFQRAGARLVSWEPTASGGDMVLETPWPQVSPTFSMLADRGMHVLAFSLRSEKGVLNLALQLVRDDER